MTAHVPEARQSATFAAYVFDLDGTVYLDDRALPGAVEAIAELRARGARIAFVTNKPLATAAEYAAKLQELGIAAVPADVVTAVDALVDYLRSRHPAARLLLIAEDTVERACADAGFAVVEGPGADVVVVSFDRRFEYEKLRRAFRAVRAGAVIVATNPDPFCPTADGGDPDCAAMLAAVEACTGATAEAIVGKPSAHMLASVMARLRLPADRCAVVGDRIATDVAMGIAGGMTGILVTTGATDRGDVAASPVQPHLVVDSLTELL